jgi:hypothetical protein
VTAFAIIVEQHKFQDGVEPPDKVFTVVVPLSRETAPEDNLLAFDKDGDAGFSSIFIARDHSGGTLNEFVIQLECCPDGSTLISRSILID